MIKGSRLSTTTQSMAFRELLLFTTLKRWLLASMEGRIQLFYCICLELDIICTKRNKKTLMKEFYKLQLDIICEDFKSGLEYLLKAKPIRAIFLGVRTGDPTAVGQEQFSPSSCGWPPFMRVNPILDWSYRDVWAFLLTSKVPYCSLYDQGYTSIGSIYDTVPNKFLCISDSSSSKMEYRPAHMLADGRLERAGRARKSTHGSHSNISLSNGTTDVEAPHSCIPTASVIGVGDEILCGSVEDLIGPSLCRKLHSIGWAVTQFDILRNNIDSIADIVERQKSINHMVFVYGGIGPLHSDATLAGIAKAFGVRLAPDEEFEEYLTNIVGLLGYHYTGDRNEMKCQNVIIFMATNLMELNNEWNCLIELSTSNRILMLTKPFVSKYLSTNLTEVEVAQPLSALHIDFPDLYIGSYRKSRRGPLVITLEGKDQGKVQLATEALVKKFNPGTFSVTI
ncbi:uncharacterized protein LOC130826779 isoform X2 [Amaranthus tricolor]|uniref:uncharacterized protein LOC130826779 isoform X2 n=1 Tax=Amaranthus tricolor TaxID=29722 RepID=UPI002584D9DB|nr:uncharacterized protein LOC130826779 isoform X2 [Amaranthus tricolor]